MHEGISQMTHPRGGDRQRPSRRPCRQPQVKLTLTRRQALRATAFSNSTSAPLWADPRCSISRDPRREEYTICTAVAPDDVFTVRTYGTRQLTDTQLVRTSDHHNPRTTGQQPTRSIRPGSCHKSGEEERFQM